MCNSNKDNIIQMYYNEHLRPTDISKALNIDNAYITRIIKQDERYQMEKEQRNPKIQLFLNLILENGTLVSTTIIVIKNNLN